MMMVPLGVAIVVMILKKYESELSCQTSLLNSTLPSCIKLLRKFLCLFLFSCCGLNWLLRHLPCIFPLQPSCFYTVYMLVGCLIVIFIFTFHGNKFYLLTYLLYFLAPYLFIVVIEWGDEKCRHR